jgi:hypothetical protein
MARVFRPMLKGSQVQATALAAHAVAAIVKRYAARAALDPVQFAGQPTRRVPRPCGRDRRTGVQDDGGIAAPERRHAPRIRLAARSIQEARRRGVPVTRPRRERGFFSPWPSRCDPTSSLSEAEADARLATLQALYRRTGAGSRTRIGWLTRPPVLGDLPRLSRSAPTGGDCSVEGGVSVPSPCQGQLLSGLPWLI